MTIIDCHTHLGRNKHITGTADQLLSSMDLAKIDKSLVFAGHINDCTNRWLLEQIDSHKDRLYGVASVNLTAMNALPGTTGESCSDMSIQDMLDTLCKDNVVALKIYTGYEHFAPNCQRVRQVLDLVAEYSKVRTIIFHIGDCLNSVTKAKLIYAQPLDVDDVAVDYPNFNFVIAHLGFPWVRETAEVCYKNANVYTDMSGFVYGAFKSRDKDKFEKVLDEFENISSIDKLLFGTDWPISDQESYVNSLGSIGWNLELLSYTASKIFHIK